MPRFLFTAWPFAGHIHPCLAIAHELRNRGHQVAFYTGESLRPEIEGEGFRCFSFHNVDEQRIKTLASSEIPYCPSLLDRLKSARLLQSKFKEWLLDTVPDQVKDLEAVMSDWHPDALVCDLAVWAPFLVLHEARRIPVAVLSILAACILPGPDAPAWGQGKPRPKTRFMRFQAKLERVLLKTLSRRFRAQVNVMRAHYGLAALDCSVTEHAGRMPAYLVPSAPEYDYQRTDLPSSVHYVGPCLWDKPKHTPAPAWLTYLPGNRPLIYVTEATIGTQEPFLLRAAVLAFKDAPYDVIVTTGKQRSLAEAQPHLSASNVRVEAYVPQSDLLPRVSVMVTLGGSGGVLAALKAGVPLVIVPTEWDRPENAQRVLEAGAGLRLAAKRCTPERLRRAVEHVLLEPSFRANAERLARVFAQQDGPLAAAKVLEQMCVLPIEKELSQKGNATPDNALTEAFTYTP